MWGYGQCLDTIKGIVMELNSLFSMLIELLTNDSLLQSATNTVPDLVSAARVNCGTIKRSPPVEITERFIFPFSSEKTR